ncbi:MAG: hypothetical protein ACOY45_00485 [Pseudomonadota bacterium]
MLMMLAAIGLQTATLEADSAKAALTCARAVAVADAGQSPLKLTAQLAYYVMHSAKIDQGGNTYLGRVQDLTATVAEGPEITSAQAKALMPQCQKRFPVKVGAELSADPLQRDLMCLGSLGILMGAAQAMAEDGGDSTELDRLTPIYSALSPKLTNDRLAAAGITSDDQMSESLGNALKASLDIGDPDVVSRACAAYLMK